VAPLGVPGGALEDLLRDGLQAVLLRAPSLGGGAEEMPWAYEDVADVVDVAGRARLSRRVARLRPLAVVKG